MGLLEMELWDIWRSNLGTMIISSGIWRLGSGMVNPFWPLYVIQLGGNTFHVGLISAVSSVLAIIPTILGGYLADTWGRKRIVYSMSLLMGLDTLIYILAPSWEWLMLGKSLDAIFSGLRSPAFSALIADSTNTEDRAFSYGLWQSVPTIFGLASPWIIGIFMDRIGILAAQRWAYVVLMIAATTAGILRWRFLEEPLPPDHIERIKPVKALQSTLSNFKETINSLNNQVWILLLLGGLFQLGVATGNIFMVNYATDDVIGLSSSQWGFITTVSLIAALIASVPLAIISDRFGRKKLALTSLIMTPVALFAFIRAGGFVITIISYVSLVLLGSMGSVASQPLFVDYSPQFHRGRITAISRVLGATQRFSFRMRGQGTVIGALGNVIGGYLYNNVSYRLPFQIMSGMIALTAFITGIFVKEAKEPED
jgi:MFS family permease